MRDYSRVQKGHLVEFSKDYHFSWPPADKSLILMGVAIEEEKPDHTVRVETPKGIVTARYIHAYAWLGWMPEDLEPIYEKHNAETYDDPYAEEY